jgi:alpha-1,2-glucosyltransferase
MIPLYLLAAAIMQQCWSSPTSQTLLFQCAYWQVVGMCLVPTPLLEFRYFTTPFLIWFLHSAPALVTPMRSAVAIIGYTAVNVVTLTIFVYKPFTWPDGSEARFMW